LRASFRAPAAELIRIDRLATKNPLGIYGNASILAKIIAKYKVDLVHARSRAPAWSALWAARRMKKPFVTTYHGVYNAKSAPKKLYNSVMARGDLVIANSEFTATHVRKEYREVASRIVTIHRVASISANSRRMRFCPHARLLLRRPGDWAPDGTDAIILLPARMTGWKGHREAIAAAAHADDATKDLPWRMIFAGDDQGREGYVQELAHLITQHGLDDRIAIVGHCDDMPAALRPFGYRDRTLQRTGGIRARCGGSGSLGRAGHRFQHRGAGRDHRRRTDRLRGSAAEPGRAG
jgi:glycosyltransferase involved in cell wall biosynthesis